MKNIFNLTSFFILLFIGGWVCVIFACVHQNEFKNFLYQEALNGNPAAIYLFKHHKKPWELDERIIRKALEGNSYAQEILMKKRKT